MKSFWIVMPRNSVDLDDLIIQLNISQLAMGLPAGKIHYWSIFLVDPHSFYPERKNNC